MALFGHRPRTAHPSTGPGRVALLNPRDEGNPKHATFIGLDQAGLSLLIYGPGDIRRCFTALADAAPAFHTTRLASESPYVGCFPGRSAIMWMALDGPGGSAVAVHCFPHCDTDFTTTQIAKRVSGPQGALRPPWQFGIGTVGARVPVGFADVFVAAQAIPLGALPGLERFPMPVAEGRGPR